ncbi:MAG TPA: hypothetical protein VK658_06030 [Chryseolinea sp.]|nr:hypothetical protein [Chryseolinea sp.]
MKEKYFLSLKKLSDEIDELATPDEDKVSSIFYKAEEIVRVFNQQRAVYPRGIKELCLNNDELTTLKTLIGEIWAAAARKRLAFKPEPKINDKSLPV